MENLRKFNKWTKIKQKTSRKIENRIGKILRIKNLIKDMELRVQTFLVNKITNEIRKKLK